VTATSFNQKTIGEFHARNGLGIAPWGDHLLLLTSKGARTGQDVTTPLVYRRDGDDYVVVASKGGAPRDPQWYRNVLANPVVELEVAGPSGTERFEARARAVTSGPDHERLYAYMTEVWPAFRSYAAKAPRVIPVVVLERL